MELHARVTGKVQGVGFRAWVRRRAIKLELSGTVQNSPDGTVLVTARGEITRLRRLVTLLKRGPESSRVDSVTVQYQKFSTPEGGDESQRRFEIV